LAQMGRIFIDGEAGAVGRQLEQNTVADAEVERFEPEAIDHAGSAQADAVKMSLPGLLLTGVSQAKGHMVDAAAAEPRPRCIGLHVDANFLARPAAIHLVNDNLFSRVVRV